MDLLKGSRLGSNVSKGGGSHPAWMELDLEVQSQNYLPLARLFYKIKSEHVNWTYQGPSTEVGCSVSRSQGRVICETRDPCAASMRPVSCCCVFLQLLFATYGFLSHFVSRIGLLTFMGY